MDTFNLWVRACGNILKLFILYAIVPSILLHGLASLIFSEFKRGSMVGETINLVILIILYFLGVIAVCRHIDWRRKYISHLLEPKSKE